MSVIHDWMSLTEYRSSQRKGLIICIYACGLVYFIAFMNSLSVQCNALECTYANHKKTPPESKSVVIIHIVHVYTMYVVVYVCVLCIHDVHIMSIHECHLADICKNMFVHYL